MKKNIEMLKQNEKFRLTVMTEKEKFGIKEVIAKIAAFGTRSLTKQERILKKVYLDKYI
ncbi:MAG: hypothetical protein ACOCRK_03715 [bacterium]